jgi:uncharacterized protein YdhG (YjbR/CyaY superfamily)
MSTNLEAANPDSTDPRVDAYIDRAADFAQPILRHIRDQVHRHAPELTEDIKWGMPAYMYRGSSVRSRPWTTCLPTR